MLPSVLGVHEVMKYQFGYISECAYLTQDALSSMHILLYTEKIRWLSTNRALEDNAQSSCSKLSESDLETRTGENNRFQVIGIESEKCCFFVVMGHAVRDGIILLLRDKVAPKAYRPQRQSTETCRRIQTVHLPVSSGAR